MPTLSEPTTARRRFLALCFTVDGFWNLQAWGLLLLIVMSFFPPLFHIEEYLFLVLFIATLAAAWKTKRLAWIQTPLDGPLLLFVGWVLITIPFAIDVSYSFGEWRKFVVQMLVFYWVVTILHHKADRLMPSKVMAAVMVGTVVLCMMALQDFWLRGGTWQDRFIRAGAPLSDYNWLTTYLVIVIPLLIALFIVSKERWKQVTAVSVSALALLTQAAAYTRAGWLGMIAQAISLGFLTARRQVLLWMTIGVLLIGTAFIAVSQTGYQRQTLDPWTLGARVAVWQLQWQEAIQHPLVGIGYGSGTFMKRFAGYPQAKKADGPHSTFFMILMGSGFPALIIFLWLIVRMARVLLNGANKMPAKDQRLFMLATVVMLVGFFVRNAFDYMFAGSIAYLFWMLVGVGVNEARQPISHAVLRV